MAVVRQKPPKLDLEFIAGNPFGISVTSTGATVTAPVVHMTTGGGTAYTTDPGVPTATQASAVTTVAFSTTDTAALNATVRKKDYLWSLQALVDGVGPYELVAGLITVHPVGSSAATSTATSLNLALTVDGVNVALEVDLGGSGGGAVDSVNGQTGVVVLDAADVGADISGAASTAQAAAIAAAATDATTKANAAQAASQPLATVLTNTTAAFTIAQETKLDGIATGATVYTDEMARDALGAALAEGSGIDITVDDSGDTITIAATGGLGAVVLSGTPAIGQVPKATSTTTATWQTPIVYAAIVHHAADATVARPTANIVIWDGSVQPDNLGADDVWLDSSAVDASTLGGHAALYFAVDAATVHVTGAETVAGVKTFSSSPVVPDSSFTIAKTTGLQTALDAKAPLASPTFTGTVDGVTKSMVGLGSVDNTADTAKPVSTAQQTALDLKAPLASPTFTGTVVVPDASFGVAKLSATGTPGGTTYLRGDNTWATPSGGGGTTLPIFGTGADGDVVISGNTTLTNDMYYHDLTVNAGVTLTSAQFRIFCSGTLTIDATGTIASNGVAGSFGGGGAAPTAKTLGTGFTGGNGGTAAGSNGTGATTSIGGAGGNGGAGTSGAGGTGGTLAAPTDAQGGANIANDLVYAITGTLAGTAVATQQRTGAGGGGGGGDGTTGGGGGSGGGQVLVVARVLAGTGTISAVGGAGASPAAGNRGGGGGGGGGAIKLITSSTSNPYTLTVAGGSGAAPTGTGVAGSNGSAGRTFVFLGV